SEVTQGVTFRVDCRRKLTMFGESYCDTVQVAGSHLPERQCQPLAVSNRHHGDVSQPRMGGLRLADDFCERIHGLVLVFGGTLQQFSNLWVAACFLAFGAV